MLNSSYRDFQHDCEYLYAHWLNLRKIESPNHLTQRFYQLFIDGVEYSDPEILGALNRILVSKWSDKEFHNILNRCYYILINHWWLQSEVKQGYKQATIDLFQLLTAPSSHPPNCLATRRLREFVRQFSRSPQYEALKQRVQIISPDSELGRGTNYKHPNWDAKAERIGNLVHRYPWLYPHYLLDWDTSETGQFAIKKLQKEREQQFEQDLLGYTTNLLRRSHHSRHATVQTIKNPTLLTIEELEIAIKHFAGRAENSFTYQDLAKQFLARSHEASSYKAVKRQLFDYLTGTLNRPGEHSKKKYGSHYFDRWLTEQLDTTLPQSDSLKPNDSLLVKTCAHLIDVLVASPNQPSNHIVFVDLNTNLPPAHTIGLLLKIVLLCQRVQSNLEAIKSHLAKRFAILLKHYETKVRGEIEWLVDCLENLMIAFSIHFGQADFSWVKLLA